MGFSSLIRDLTQAPCIGMQSLNHWDAREVPTRIILFNLYNHSISKYICIYTFIYYYYPFAIDETQARSVTQPQSHEVINPHL